LKEHNRKGVVIITVILDKANVKGGREEVTGEAQRRRRRRQRRQQQRRQMRLAFGDDCSKEARLHCLGCAIVRVQRCERLSEKHFGWSGPGLHTVAQHQPHLRRCNHLTPPRPPLEEAPPLEKCLPLSSSRTSSVTAPTPSKRCTTFFGAPQSCPRHFACAMADNCTAGAMK
jgi:hypothetical protein